MNAALPWAVLGLLASLSAVLTFEYYVRVELADLEMRVALHSGIVDATAPSQYRHRILVPHLVNALAKGLRLLLRQPQRLRPQETGSLKAFVLAYLAYDFAAILFSLTALYLLLTAWFTSAQSLVGALLAAFSMQLTFRDHFFHPWSLLEFGLFAAGFLLIYRERHKWFALVLIVASLNRETSVFLLLAFFFARVVDWRGKPIITSRSNLWLFAVYTAIWLAIFFGLRLILGFPPPTFTVQEAWRANTSGLFLRAAVLNSLFFGIFWLYIVLGFRRAPGFIRRASLFVPFYAALLFVIGLWYEIRYLMTLLPVFIPLGLSYLYPVSGGDEKD